MRSQRKLAIRKKPMQIHRLAAHRAYAFASPTALAIGNFDGVHAGHRAVLEAMLQAARAQGLVPAVLTFAPHPKRFFAAHSSPFQLQTTTQKCAMLHAFGVQQVFVLRFDTRAVALSAHEFMQQVLQQQCGARVVVTGDDFSFGKGRAGTVNMLAECGAQYGFTAHAVPAVMMGGARCSSTAIREALQQGDMVRVNALLGYDYTLHGRVVHGDGRGASIGFATANLALSRQLVLPAHGVYAVRLRQGDSIHDAVANIGTRPTFDGMGTRLEVHVLDGAPQLYGAKVSVQCVAHLRTEQKFDGVDALRAQIQKDCESARQVLRA
jgi:riboflavin kinase / FMN adenylyltransferase